MSEKGMKTSDDMKMWRSAMNTLEIGTYYGMEAQARQTMEECGELIAALNKYLRTTVGGQKTDVTKTEARAAVVEEMADVQVMLMQMMMFLHCADEVDRIATAKQNRTLERIEQEKREKARARNVR